jgi:hypothetical protein
MATPETVMEQQVPRLLRIAPVERHASDRSRLVVVIGEGACPWCGWGGVRAEAGSRGFCPSCAGPILAVLRTGGAS